MESSAVSLSVSPGSYSAEQQTAALNLTILQDSIRSTDDQFDTSIDSLGQSLAISSQEIIKKLNEYLKDTLPGGIESLNPEDYTSEATADRIVGGITSLYEVYKKQNSNLSDEELLTNFMSLARKGVDQGYQEAFQILDGFGAFGVEGVQSGIEQTKILIESKLAAFENQKREELGLSSSEPQSQVATNATQNFVAQAGRSISVVA